MADRDPAAGTPTGPPEEDPRIAGEKHPVARMIALGIVCSLVGIAIALSIDWFPEAASGSADKIDTVYDVLLICSVPIFVLVMTVAIYSVVRFRAKPGDTRDGAPIHGNTRLEVIWVTIPFLMVTALAIYGWITLDDLEAKQPNELIVHVTGQQFTWTFEYPSEKVTSNELVLPDNRPVEFRINTKDVLHSFWVPQFRLKSDAVPGLTTKIRLTPNKVGRYEVVCAELCGIGHSTMRQNVRVVRAGRVRRLAARAEEGRERSGRRRGRRRSGRWRRRRRRRRRAGLRVERLRQLPHARRRQGDRHRRSRPRQRRQADRGRSSGSRSPTRTRSSRRDSSLTSCPRTSATSCRPTNSTRSWSTF